MLSSAFAADSYSTQFYYVLVNREEEPSGVNAIHFSSNKDDIISDQPDFPLDSSKTTQYYLMVHSTIPGNYNLKFTFEPLYDSNTKSYAPYNVWIDNGESENFSLTTTTSKEIDVKISTDNYTAGSFDKAYEINYSFGDDALEGTYTSDVKVTMDVDP